MWHKSIPKIFVFISIFISGLSYADSRWGADYFPNVTLTSHSGEEFQFFEDLIKDKIVVINFIYTTCPDVCPLETAQLTRVQRIIGDALGKEIFFYSISIDPENDTLEALSEYREKFGAKWMFLRGEKEQVIELRRKLGLYIEDIEGGENNHNVNMIIGNQATGRWMKRSPFENPYVLADQIGNWLSGWKKPQELQDYEDAPDLRNISEGENLFRTRCLSCHSIDGSADQAIGPDLLGVDQRRDRKWLIRWLKEPDVMLKEKDPIAISLFNQYKQVAMPNMGLTQVDVMDLLNYMSEQTALSKETNTNKDDNHEPKNDNEDVVAIMNAWVRQAMPGAKVNAGYMTLINVSSKDVTLKSVHSDAAKTVEIHEMKTTNGTMQMNALEEIVIPAAGKVILRPGHTHLMLKQPKTDLISGEKVELILTFNSGKKQSLTVDVKNK